MSQGLSGEPAFNWWVPHTLRKREAIIKLARSRSARYLKKTHKFGIELPKSVAHALELDRRNGNTLWADAIAKEMKDVRPAFKILDPADADPVGHQRIRCHMIFDIKMEDFRRKARLVAGGHVTEAPATMTYASVVARDTVRIALLLAALNDLDLMSCNIGNAYLNAKCRERIWFFAGAECGPDLQGCVYKLV